MLYFNPLLYGVFKQLLVKVREKPKPRIIGYPNSRILQQKKIQILNKKITKNGDETGDNELMSCGVQRVRLRGAFGRIAMLTTYKSIQYWL